MLKLARHHLDEALARVNAPLQEPERVTLVTFEPPRFVLRFPPPTSLPEDKCVDQRFTAIQFDLHEHARIDTGIQGAEWREEEGAYLVQYEEIDW